MADTQISLATSTTPVSTDLIPLERSGSAVARQATIAAIVRAQAASTTDKGSVELATAAEAAAGSSSSLAVTPAGLAYATYQITGAAGDGVTDDAAIIQAAIDAVTSGSKIFLPDADYMIKSTLTISGKTVNLSCVGSLHVVAGGTRERRGVRLIWGGATGQPMISIVTASNVVLDYFFLDGGGVANVTGISIDSSGAGQYGCEINRCSFKRLNVGIDVGATNPNSSEGTVIRSPFFDVDVKTGIRSSSVNTYTTSIYDPFFQGDATGVDYHIYVTHGHFTCYGGYFGLASTAAIRIVDGSCNMLAPYSETHNVPFLIWDAQEPSGAQVCIFNPQLNQSGVTYNIINNSVGTVNLFGGYITGIQSTNALSYENLFGTQYTNYSGTNNTNLSRVNSPAAHPFPFVYTPTGTADSFGSAGDVMYDADYLYTKTAAGWKRAALGTW